MPNGFVGNLFCCCRPTSKHTMFSSSVCVCGPVCCLQALTRPNISKVGISCNSNTQITFFKQTQSHKHSSFSSIFSLFCKAPSHLRLRLHPFVCSAKVSFFCFYFGVFYCAGAAISGLSRPIDYGSACSAPAQNGQLTEKKEKKI